MSTEANTGGNAFPHAQRLWDNDAQSWAVHSVGGMTLRDYFAAAALPAVLRDYDNWAETAYRVADTMLAERAKPIAAKAEQTGSIEQAEAMHASMVKRVKVI